VKSTLRKQLTEYLSRSSPGLLEFFNIYCTLIYETDCLTLLFTTPSKLYHIFTTHFKGDIVSADHAFTILFLKPLAHILGREDIVRELLDYAKTSRDKEFTRLLLDYRDSSIKS